MPPSDRLARPKEGARKEPVRTADVSRLEIENLYTQVETLMTGLRRVEADLQRLTERVHRVEKRSDKNGGK